MVSARRPARSSNRALQVCIDRIYCNLYVPKLQCELGVVGFIREHLGKPVASTAVLAERTEKFYAEVRAFAAAQGIHIVEFAAGQRKDDVMREQLAAFLAAGRAEGVVFIGRAQERRADGQKTDGSPPQSQPESQPQKEQSERVMNEVWQTDGIRWSGYHRFVIVAARRSVSGLHENDYCSRLRG